MNSDFIVPQGLPHKNLPHALLFVGADGIGKKTFALAYARALLCSQAVMQEKQFKACDHCHNCHLFKAQSHPDLMWVEPEAESSVIKIDQIREVVEFVNTTALQGGLRIVVITPASAMNSNAANALLKTLEEPAPQTLIILINNQNLQLPATILSRCQKVFFNKPSEAVALQWLETQVSSHPVDLRLLLKLVDGVPLTAKAWLENGIFTLRQELYENLVLLADRKQDPLQLALRYQEQDLKTIVHLMLIWLQDVCRYQLIGSDAELINSDFAAAFARVVKTTHAPLLNYIESTQKTYAQILQSVSLNRLLVLEELFIRWGNYAAS